MNRKCRLILSGALVVFGVMLLVGCGRSDSGAGLAELPSSTVENRLAASSTASSVPLETSLPAPGRTSESIMPETPRPTVSPPEQRIGVRYVDGVGEFYNRQTGENFIPRGFNYVRLAPMPAGSSNLWHATLNPGYYEPEQAAAALADMHAKGYNVVRIFVDCCRKGSNVGDPGGGISEPYLRNVIDFLEKARENEIYVLLILDLTPAEGGYDDLWQSCCTRFDGDNLRYLTPGGHSAERRFNQDFIRALISHGAPMEAIFAYDLTNEVSFSVDQPPFSFTAGTIRTANGQVYDMENPDDKTRMLDENLVYWIDRQREAILEVDPAALVAVSFPAINTGRTTVHIGPAIRESTADFIDLHMYLGWGLTLEDYMARFEFDAQAEIPVILGEFGAAVRHYFTEEAAASALVELQAASCAYGFDGWLMWTWDTADQVDLWHGMSDTGRIAAALAPVNRPDPCSIEGSW